MDHVLATVWREASHAIVEEQVRRSRKGGCEVVVGNAAGGAQRRQRPRGELAPSELLAQGPALCVEDGTCRDLEKLLLLHGDLIRANQVDPRASAQPFCRAELFQQSIHVGPGIVSVTRGRARQDHQIDGRAPLAPELVRTRQVCEEFTVVTVARFEQQQGVISRDPHSPEPLLSQAVGGHFLRLCSRVGLRGQQGGEQRLQLGQTVCRKAQAPGLAAGLRVGIGEQPFTGGEGVVARRRVFDTLL